MTLGAFGLSAAAVTQAFKIFFAETENIDGFLLFLSIALASLSYLGMLAVRHVSGLEIVQCSNINLYCRYYSFHLKKINRKVSLCKNSFWIQKL
mgnify:CR=1 FL=1